MDVSCISVLILCILKNFHIHSGILKLFEENFHEGIRLYLIYFSLTDINIRTVIISFSRVHLMNLSGICDLLTHFTKLLHQ